MTKKEHTKKKGRNRKRFNYSCLFFLFLFPLLSASEGFCVYQLNDQGPEDVENGSFKRLTFFVNDSTFCVTATKHLSAFPKLWVVCYVDNRDYGDHAVIEPDRSLST